MLAKTTIPKLDKIFTAYGIPYEMTSDNGPPFKSNEFKDFMKHTNIKHRRITPLWPQANANAENFNRRLRKIIQSAHIEKKNWKQEVYTFLRNYRSTPHISTGKAPAELMFPGRSYRTKIPEIRKKHDDYVLRQKDKESKNKMKKYADKNRNVKSSNFQINDTVLVKQPKTNKLTPPFDTDPYVIIAIKGNMITARSTTNERCITRNSSFFKKIPCRKNSPVNNYISDTDESGPEGNNDIYNEINGNNIEEEIHEEEHVESNNQEKENKKT